MEGDFSEPFMKRPRFGGPEPGGPGRQPGGPPPLAGLGGHPADSFQPHRITDSESVRRYSRTGLAELVRKSADRYIREPVLFS